MIIQTLFALAALLSCRKLILKLKKLINLRKKVSQTQIMAVSDLIRKINNLPAKSKIFAIVKGLVKSKNSLLEDKTIYSIIQSKSIRKGNFFQHFQKKNYEKIAKTAYWKKPHSQAKLSFVLQDMQSLDRIDVLNCKKTNLSGALTEVLVDRNELAKSQNIFYSFALKIYNFLIRIFPLNLIFNRTKIGEENTLYAIQNNQFSIVIGQIEKTVDNNIICRNPKFLTKQRTYIQKKLMKIQRTLVLFLMISITVLLIFVFKFLRKLINWCIKRRQLSLQIQNVQRDEEEGQNCNCIVCFQNIRSIVFKPCRHYALCKECYDQLKKHDCPYCKKSIVGIIQIIKQQHF